MQSIDARKSHRAGSTRWALWAFGTVALLGGAVAVWVPTQAVGAADVLVYKSPTCGCCDKWVEHLEAAGFTVDVEDRENLVPIKARFGIPLRLQSCHTARVGEYLVEGHVPADLIERLLREKPNIRGLSVPGMPMGSPGMEGPRKDDYNVLAINEDGSTTVYARR